MERSGVFLVFPTVQVHCRSPTGRSSTGSNDPRPYKWLGRRMQRAHGCDLLPVRSLLRCSLLCRRGAGAWSLEHARAFAIVWLARDCFWPEVALQWRSCTQMLQLRSWPCTQRSSRVGSEATRSASAQRHSRCRILSQNVQLSTNDRAFARRVSSFTCTTWVRSFNFAHPKINVLHLPQQFSQLEARNTDDDNAKQQKRKIEYSSIRSLSHVHQFRIPCSNRRISTRPRGTIAVLAQTNAIFSLHNRAAGRGRYISYGRNLWTCLNRPEFQTKISRGLASCMQVCTQSDKIWKIIIILQISTNCSSQRTFNRPLSRFLLLLQFHAKAIVRLTWRLLFHETAVATKTYWVVCWMSFGMLPSGWALFFSDDRHETDNCSSHNINWEECSMQPTCRLEDHYQAHLFRTNFFHHQHLIRLLSFSWALKRFSHNWKFWVRSLHCPHFSFSMRFHFA